MIIDELLKTKKITRKTILQFVKKPDFEKPHPD